MKLQKHVKELFAMYLMTKEFEKMGSISEPRTSRRLPQLEGETQDISKKMYRRSFAADGKVAKLSLHR